MPLEVETFGLFVVIMGAIVLAIWIYIKGELD